MADNQNKNQNDLDLDIDLAIGSEGAQVLSTEQLKEIKKKLPKWSILPPSKYKDEK